MKTILLIATLISVVCSATFAQKPRVVTASEANGTYRNRSSEIRILALGRNKLKVQFELAYEYRNQYGLTAHTGEAAGEATIENDTAVFTSSEFGQCKITMTFLPGGKLKVEQQGSDADCGFGHNVTADGTYRKVSSRKPKFDENR